jgi:hypothetical protein
MKSLNAFQKAGAVLAALIGSVVSLDASAAMENLPRERVSGVASYVSGGVSLAQSQTFEHAFRDYPLVVKLYEHQGPRDVYTADALVRIADAQGHTVIDAKADGPFMLVRLPHGDYTVTASLGEHVLPAHHVRVTDHGHANATFVFPAHSG